MQGLTESEAAERRQAGLMNVSSTKPSRSVGKIIASNTLTYFNFVFLLISILLISAGSPIRNFTFLPIIVANALIGIVQELRAKKVLDRLSVLSTPIARVMREGRMRRVPITELVQDDVIFLKAGDQISADAVVVEGVLMVNEALLTGEADEIEKKVGSELMSGSFVVSGEGYARLTRVGDAAYAAQLTLKARAIRPGEQSEIIKGLNYYVRVAGAVMIPVAVAMVAGRLRQGVPYPVAIEAMVAAVISMIPEGLFLLSSATLVLSAMRLAEQKVLLHDMKSIETLARVDVLCVDKTGTITTGQMKVAEVTELKPGASDALSAVVGALSEDSETMRALKEYVGKQQSAEHYSAREAQAKPLNTGVEAVKTGVNLAKKWQVEAVQGFSSRLKYSGVDFGKDGVFVLGAPELALREDFTEVAKQVKSISRKGLRVLVLAKYAGKLNNKALSAGAKPWALVVLEDEVRESAVETFRYFAEQGVEIKVISGDAPLTVAAVAERAGIRNADKCIDMSNSLSDKALMQAAQEKTVFGRVTPADKRRLVRALQAAGRTVAMTGDGVNDVLALKDADCSIAMASGADAAAGAAQMVLLESDFSKMPSIVAEGRRVVNNLQRSGSLFIVKNLFSFAAAVIVILVGMVYPMVPAQVSLITFWAIGVPSFLLAQIPNRERIRGDFMQNILKAAIPTALAAVMLLTLANVAMRMLKVRPELIGTVTTLIWAGIALLHLFMIARPYNHWSITICVGCLIGVVMSFLVASPLFALESGMGLLEWGLIGGSVALAYPLMRLNRWLIGVVWRLLPWVAREEAVR